MLDLISLKTSQRKWAASRLEGRTSLIFSSCGRWSRLTMGTSGTRSGGIRKGQSPCELLGGLSGFLSRRCWGLRPCVESVQEPEDSTPVLTWFLGYFWSLPKGVSVTAYKKANSGLQSMEQQLTWALWVLIFLHCHLLNFKVTP